MACWVGPMPVPGLVARRHDSRSGAGGVPVAIGSINWARPGMTGNNIRWQLEGGSQAVSRHFGVKYPRTSTIRFAFPELL